MGADTSTDLPLHGVRVVECGDTLAAAYAGRILCDLGADVVKVEPAGGDPLRSLGPFLGGVPDRDLSAPFGYYAAGKRSLVADVGAELPDPLRGLIARADVVVRSTSSGERWVSDRHLEEARRQNPGLIAVEISTYGSLVADDAHPMSDLLALAAGGLLSVNGADPNDPDALPLRYRGEMASVHSACSAVLAVLGALFEQRRSGHGQHIDVSAQAAVTSVLATGPARFSYEGTTPVRGGTRAVGPWAFYRCSDGLVLIQCTEDQEWHRLLDVFGNPEWGDMEIFATTAQREQVADVLDGLVSEALAQFTVEEFVAAAYKHRVPAAPIHSGADLLSWRHLRDRQFFDRVRMENGERSGEIRVPGTPWRFSAMPRVQRGPAPMLGDSTAAAQQMWPVRRSSQATAAAGQPPAAAQAPLAGVMVVDLTWVWAGPFAAMQLAHLGADVIKVESSTRIDVTRRLGPYADGVPGINRSGYFNQYNQGKKSICLNLKTAEGVALLRRLLAVADVVIDNMSAGALARMGFSYDTLAALNPKMVAVSMTGFGETGPERDRMAYGSLIDALSGAASANGLVGRGPTDFPMSLPDPTAGVHTALATVAALYRAARTGVGTRVECSMLEASVAAFPWPVLYRGVAGHEPPVLGNRDERRSPHGVYRCRGGDAWIAIAVENDEQFGVLAGALGESALACDPRFATLWARRVHEEELDRLLARWTALQDAGDAVAALRRAGVPCEQVAAMDDVFASPALIERGFFTELDHAEVGVRRLAGVPWRTSRSPMRATTAAPLLGQHTQQVLRQRLGLTDAEIDDLERCGALR